MHKLQLFILMIVGLAIFAGCENSSSNGPVGIANESSASLMKTGGKSVTPQTIASTGVVTVIHGVPGLVVDVYVNGALTLPGFKPGTITPPIQLPEGNYYIQITPQGQDTTQTVIKGSAFLPAGANASIIAHLTESGMPTLSVYVNNLQGLGEDKSRLVVRHDAAAPAVDVNLYRGRKAKKFVAKFPNLSNPNELSADVHPGRYAATLVPAGTSTVVFGPAPLRLKPGVEYIVYAFGSLSDKSFGLLVQTIDLRRSHDEGDDQGNNEDQD